MTNLSTVSRLDALVQAKRLFPYVPQVPTVPEGKRWIWMTKGAQDWLDHPGREFKSASVAMAIQQLDRFVNGLELEDKIDLKLLDPREHAVWEIRTVLVPHHIRIFGWFPCPKHFVFVHAKPREALGAYGDPKWNRAISKVRSMQNELLPDLKPYAGFSFNDHV